MQPPAVTVLGAGLVGVATAWLLLNRGYPVCLIDPAGAGEQAAEAGTRAATAMSASWVNCRRAALMWAKASSITTIDANSYIRRAGFPRSFRFIEIHVLTLSIGNDMDNNLSRMAERRKRFRLPGVLLGVRFIPREDRFDCRELFAR